MCVRYPVYIYVCICISGNVYIHVYYICIYLSMYIYIYIHTYIHTYVYICIYVYTYICMSFSVLVGLSQTYILTYIHTRARAYMCAYTQKRARTDMGPGNASGQAGSIHNIYVCVCVCVRYPTSVYI